MTNKTQLPVEVVEKILKARDALIVGDKDEAYHQLYGIASPGYDSYYPWREMELQVNYPIRYEKQIKETFEVTEYAIKLQELKKEFDAEMQKNYEALVAERVAANELKARCEKMEAVHAGLILALAAMLNGYQNLSMHQKDWFTIPKDLIDAYTKMVLEYDNTQAPGEGKEVGDGM